MELTSGHAWEADPANQFDRPGRSPRKGVRATDDHQVTAIAKWNPQAHPAEVYGLGMERVASELGALIDIPIPGVWLEDVEGKPAAVVQRVPRALAWSLANPDVRPKLENREVWPRSLVFDVWIANYDRVDRNLLIEPVPPGTEFAAADRFRLWLIDHGLAGLLWATKFDLSVGSHEVGAISVGDGDMLERFERTAREMMPRDYKDAYWASDGGDREQALDRVRQVADDDIDGIVEEIPDAYMGAAVREQTKVLLKGRRDRVDILMGRHWA